MSENRDDEFSMGTHQPIKVRHSFATKVLFISLIYFALLGGLCCYTASIGQSSNFQVESVAGSLWTWILGSVLVEYISVSLIVSLAPKLLQTAKAGYALLAIFCVTEMLLFAAASLEIGNAGSADLVYSISGGLVKVVLNLCLVSLQTRFDIGGSLVWLFTTVMGLTAAFGLEVFRSHRGGAFSVTYFLISASVVLACCFSILSDLQGIFTTNRMYLKFLNPLFLYSIDNYAEAALQLFMAPVRLILEPRMKI